MTGWDSGNGRAEATVIVESSLPRSPSAGQLARRLLGDHMRLVVPAVALADAQLVASELLNAVVLNGQGPIDFRVTLDDQSICIHISDEGDRQAPSPGSVGTNLAGTYSLQIVDEVALHWGVRRSAGGSSRELWAELSRVG
jgi:anti-sigma regulatory factor (Ser/Thr protein kinase)